MTNDVDPTTLFINWDYLERLAKETYDIKEYAFFVAQLCASQPEYQFYLEPIYDPDEWAAAEREFFVLKNQVLLNRLCFDGYLPPGTCVVRGRQP